MPHFVAQQPQTLGNWALVVFIDARHGPVNVPQNGEHTASQPHATELNDFGFFGHEPFSDVLNLSVTVSNLFFSLFRSFNGQFKGVTGLFLNLHIVLGWGCV